MLMRQITFIVLVFVSISLSHPSYAKRAIPDDNLGYPVSISLSNGIIGTGFYFRTESHTYLVTAKHVLFDIPSLKLRASIATLLSYGRDPSDLSKNVVIVNLPEMLRTKNLRYHDNFDVAVGKIGKSAKIDNKIVLQYYSYVKVKSNVEGGFICIPAHNIKKISDVLIANDVFVFGYPSSIGMKQIPQIDYNRPLLRKGIVAGISHANRSIIIDAPVYGGNSGGPVIQVEPSGILIKFYLIGLVSQFVPYTEKWLNQQYGYSNIGISNSGYTVVVPVDSILELLWE